MIQLETWLVPGSFIMMSNVTPFPYQHLQKISSEEVILKKKMLNVYAFFDSHTKIISSVLDGFGQIVKSPVSIKLTQLVLNDLEEIKASVCETALVGLISVEPHAQKSAIIFEALLAKLLIQHILSGTAKTADKIMSLQAKPITALEEAVVQYVIISLLERLSANIRSTNFTVRYDGLYSGLAAMSRLPQKTRFVVCSVQLGIFNRDFYVKFIIPMSVPESYGITNIDDKLVELRMAQFGRFNADLLLEVARVTLEPADIEALSLGDIILFDTSKINFKDKKIQGLAELKLDSTEYDEGFLVDLEQTEDGILAKIVSAL